MTGGIYQIRNLVNGKRYVGRAKDFTYRARTHFQKLRSGRHHSAHLQRSWDKHGETAFVFEPLLVCDAGAAIRVEQKLLDAGAGEYNGSRSAKSPMAVGQRHSVAAKERIAETARGRIKTESHRANLRAALIGRVVPLETRAKISRGRKGIAVSAETRQKLRVASTGRIFSAEARAKISAALSGKPKSPEHRAKISAALTQARV